MTSHAAGATQPRGYDRYMQQREQQISHASDSVGQTSGVTRRCSKLNSAREFTIRDHRSIFPPRKFTRVRAQIFR